MFSWLCRKCDKEMFSSDPGRREKDVVCIHCGARGINPYYVGEENGGGENDEGISAGVDDCVLDEGESCGGECCGEPEQSMNEQEWESTIVHKLQEFLHDLSEVTKKHSIVIDGCGCCGSPWLDNGKVTIATDLTWDSDAGCYVALKGKCD